MDPAESDLEFSIQALGNRLAKGEISLEQYNEIKSQLQKDATLTSSEEYQILYGPIIVSVALAVIWPVHIILNWGDIGSNDRIIFGFLIGLSFSGGVLLFFVQKLGFYLTNAALFLIWIVGAGVYMTQRDRLFAEIDPPFLKEIGRWVLPLTALLYLNLSKKVKAVIFDQ